jgi:hypothetical protein
MQPLIVPYPGRPTGAAVATWNGSGYGSSVVAYLSLADLITGPVRLSPAEAAALTLAVARRLDEETSDRRVPQVPDDQGILLSSTGSIAFVRGPQAAAPDSRTALSALLMRLLRLEGDQPREHVPGGLLIVLARNLGYIQLPPTSPDAFRAALERFATSDPTLLAGIFWRAARVKGAALRRLSASGDTAPVPLDRRRAGATRAELRRALREVEHELYDTRTRLVRRSTTAPSRRTAHAVVSMGGVLRWAGIAAGVVLLASIAAGTAARTARQDVGAAVSESAVTEPAVLDSAVAESAGTEPALTNDPRVIPAAATGSRIITVRGVRSSSDTAGDSRIATDRTIPGARRSSVARASSPAQPRPPRRGRRPVTPDVTARQFAGGARQIPWTIQR